MNEESLNKLILDIKKETLERGFILIVPTIGNSMFPFIGSNDKILTVKCDTDKLRYADIILYKSDNHKDMIIAHRLLLKTKTKNGYIFVTKGDSQIYCDKPINADSVMGKIIKIKKSNFNISLEGTPGRIINIFMLFISVTELFAVGVMFLGKIKSLLRRSISLNKSVILPNRRQ